MVEQNGMAKSRKGFYVNFICMLLVMALIFLFSAQDGTESGEVSNAVLLWLLSWMSAVFPLFVLSFITVWVRKIAHFTIYTILGVFASGTVWHVPSLFRRIHGHWYYGWILAVLYACTDEFHQHFVPGRACQFRDVCIDAAGALCGVGIFYLAGYCKERIDIRKKK